MDLGASPIPLSDPVGIDVAFLGITLPLYRLIIIILAIFIFIALSIFFKKTMVGKIVVAANEDKDAVRKSGN